MQNMQIINDILIQIKVTKEFSSITKRAASETWIVNYLSKQTTETRYKCIFLPSSLYQITHR